MSEEQKNTLISKFRRIIQMSVLINQDVDTKIILTEAFNKQLTELKVLALADGLVLEEWNLLITELKADIKEFIELAPLIAA